MLSLTKENLAKALSFAVTLTVSHALKLHLQGGITLDGFTRSWLISSGGMVAGLLVSNLITEKLTRKELAERVGKEIAKRSIEKGVKNVAFDKGKYKYHGIIKILAEAARNEGLNF